MINFLFKAEDTTSAIALGDSGMPNRIIASGSTSEGILSGQGRLIVEMGILSIISIGIIIAIISIING